MMYPSWTLLSLPLALWTSTGVLASPLSTTSKSRPHPRPLVIWHGMGDSYNSPGMLEFMSLIEDMHKGIFVHSVYLDENPKDDQRACFWGDVNEQVATVAAQLSNITELAGGFDAIGFSQGGQFLRAYVERYNSPPVNNLITFGSQHMGVSDLPLCRPWDVGCQLARRAARGGVYTEWAQKNLVQAQYYRDPAQLPTYLASNRFLASINNEVPSSINTTYAKQFASLNKLILVLFSGDKTVVPKESSWFGAYAPPPDDGGIFDKTIIPMRMQEVYVEDRFGLRTLDQRGDVILETCEGEHMQLSTGCWKPLVRMYTGGPVGGDSVFRPGEGQTVFSV
ncbi:alpha/beta-hydrolase [Cristinia sonorae]|uniref:Palmitoyl-protein thioesterase 1 n=1 Tax=Cristinia sonorae TaxID=1940300 RepID=A0A8K0XVD7_9AGAR|nr:alpha/beta-hydrolase [Cristinia sonorae]